VLLRLTLFPYTTLFRSSHLSSQLVVKGRQPAFLDGLHGDAEDDVRPREILLRVIGRKCEPDVAALPDCLPDEAVGESGNEALLRSEEHTSELQSPYDLV